MPATLAEGQEIRRIILEHLPVDQAAILTEKLYNRVGALSSNNSVKLTLFGLWQLCNLSVDEPTAAMNSFMFGRSLGYSEEELLQH